MVGLVLQGAAGQQALTGLCSVQPGVEIKQQVEGFVPPLRGQGERSALKHRTLTCMVFNPPLKPVQERQQTTVEYSQADQAI